MIDGIRPPRRPNNLHPHDQEMVSQMIVGDHSQDRFKPPTEIAATNEQQTQTSTAGELLSDQPPKKKRSLKEWLQGLSKKQKILLTVVAAILAAGIVIGAYFLFFTNDAPKKVVQTQTPEPAPQPVTVASTLSGLQVDPAINERPVIASMIENSMDSRPQAGLSQAGVVFEGIAEGGITRLVALFQDTEPDYVGPVRSARTHFVQWAMGFDAALAHAGGSPDALANITKWKTKDLNHNTTAFWRVSNRTAPHNLYTSIAKLREYASSKGYGKPNFTPFPRKAEQASSTPTAKSINLNISSANFNVRYDYDQTTNSYKRSEGGAPHIDEKTSAQLAPKVVIALVMPQGISGQYTTYSTIGSGQVFIFQDGLAQTGTWKKDSNEANFSFTDAAGAQITLNPGQTWLTALGGAERVTYTP